MRGVSERESGGRAGWAAESRGGGAAAVPRTPWHRAQPPRPRGEASGSWGRPAPPSPTAGRGPGGCGSGEEGTSGGACRRSGRAPCPPSRVLAAGDGGGGWPRKGGAPGRAAGGPRGAPRTKGDGDGSSVVKTTCAGGGPRPGRGLGALHLNPFAAAASFLRLVGGRERPVLPPFPAAAERWRDGTQARRAARRPLLPGTSRLLPAPPPFPPGFRVDLPTHCYVRLGGVRGTRTI